MLTMICLLAYEVVVIVLCLLSLAFGKYERRINVKIVTVLAANVLAAGLYVSPTLSSLPGQVVNMWDILLAVNAGFIMACTFISDFGREVLICGLAVATGQRLFRCGDLQHARLLGWPVRAWLVFVILADVILYYELHKLMV